MRLMTTLPWARPLTVDGLESIPNDGHRYELLDGTLIVTPAPDFGHQFVAGALYVLLRESCPPELRVVPAPFAWTPKPDTEWQPDVVVARYADLMAAPGRKRLLAPPVLAVEVVSPSTRRVDRMLKYSAYEAAGVPAYWIVDPDPDRAVVTAYELDASGRYVEAASGAGDDEIRLDRPFPVTVVPARLCDDLRPR